MLVRIGTKIQTLPPCPGDRSGPHRLKSLRANAAAFGLRTCLHYDASQDHCRGPIVRAHSIQKRGGLSRIAVDGHVYWWRRTHADMVRQAGAVEPVRVGINHASTFTGFCAGHDSSTFRPVEVEEFTATQTQIGLFAYRPLCMEIFTKMGVRQNASYIRTLDRGKPLSEQRRIQSLVDVHESGLALGMRDLAHHKREFDEVLRQGDVKGIAGYVVEFSDSTGVSRLGHRYSRMRLSRATASRPDVVGGARLRVVQPDSN